jgi:hypothetical protein
MMREPSTTAGAEASGATAAARCVVAVAPGAQAPAALLQGLTRRGIKVALAAGEVAAMVELARSSTAAVILCDPARLARPAELVRAVERYYPKTRCWQFAPARWQGAWEMSKVNPDLCRSWAGAAPGRRPVSGNGGAGAAPGLDAAAPVLSAEELEMLLGPLPDEDPPQADVPFSGNGD